MVTLEERVAVLENRISGLVTQQELNALEKELKSAMYTMEGRLKGDIERAKIEILAAITDS